MQEPSPGIHQETDSLKIGKLAVQLIRDLFTTILPALLIALFINVYLAEAALVENGPSMQPILHSGNRVMIEKISYRLDTPGRGDVIIAEPSQSEVALIKRVVALPGETVEVRAGHVFINGAAIEEPWVENFGGPDYARKEIPAGHIFILGDNRSSSNDSRAIGPVSIDDIKGRVWMVYWPLDEIQLIP